MSTFNLQIVTPDGLCFDGAAEKLIVRAAMGDVCILANHADYVSPINKGGVTVTLENDDAKTAMCEGGFISVRNGETKILSDSFEWI